MNDDEKKEKVMSSVALKSDLLVESQNVNAEFSARHLSDAGDEPAGSANTSNISSPAKNDQAFSHGDQKMSFQKPFIKLFTKTALELLESDSDAFLLASYMVLKSRTYHKDLLPNQVFLGKGLIKKLFGWGEQKYREVKDRLQDTYKLVSFLTTHLGTTGTFLNSEIYDISYGTQQRTQGPNNAPNNAATTHPTTHPKVVNLSRENDKDLDYNNAPNNAATTHPTTPDLIDNKNIDIKKEHSSLTSFAVCNSSFENQFQIEGNTVLENPPSDNIRNVALSSMPEIPKEEPKAELEKPKKEFPKVCYELAELLYQNILKTMPKRDPPKTFENWAKEINSLLKKRTAEQIKEIIEWLPTHSFWSINVLSGGKLKKQIDVLEALKKEEEKKKTPKLSNREKVMLHFKHGEIYNGAECFVSEEAIAFQRGEHRQVKFKELGFWDQFANLLRKLGIPNPILSN